MKRGIWVQSEPWHYRWDKPHHPRRCVLCWMERIAIRLHLVRYDEED